VIRTSARAVPADPVGTAYCGAGLRLILNIVGVVKLVLGRKV
jgi:hypothetical protein